MDDFLIGNGGCILACQSIILGALLEHLPAEGILKGVRGCSFQNMDFERAIAAVKTIGSLELNLK
ncbi:hypothetical protein L209DRAFT_760025 [Thermothelomyces heterothallicus CBS 203.75]